MRNVKRIAASLLVAMAVAPGSAFADPPPYDPISICDLSGYETGDVSCDPSRIEPEVKAFVCSLVPPRPSCSIHQPPVQPS